MDSFELSVDDFGVTMAFPEQPNPLCYVLSTHYTVTINVHKFPMDTRGIVLESKKRMISRGQ